MKRKRSACLGDYLDEDEKEINPRPMKKLRKLDTHTNTDPYLETTTAVDSDNDLGTERKRLLLVLKELESNTF